MKEIFYILIVVLYLFSFQYKFYHPFFITGLVPLLIPSTVHGWSLFIILKSKPFFKSLPFIAFLLFSLTIGLSVVSHTGNSYSFGKTTLYVLITLPAYCWGYGVFGSSPKRQTYLIQGMIFFTSLVCGAAFFQVLTQGHLNTLWGNNYLVTGQSIGICAILLQVLIISTNKPWFFSGIIGCFIGLLCFNGGRGPLIMALITLLIFYIQQYFFQKKKSVLLHGIAVCLGTGIFIILISLGTFAIPQAIIRTAGALSSPLADGSIVERLTYYQQALQLFLAHPLMGVGFGLWSQTAGNIDISLHPHTIFLELGAELGCVGLLLFFLFSFPLLKILIASFRQKFNANPSLLDSVTVHPGLLFVSLFVALNALKSGDINDNILLFFCLGCLGYTKKTQQID